MTLEINIGPSIPAYLKKSVMIIGGGYSDKVLGYSPIAYWPLNEAEGAVANDLSGNEYHGTYTGVTLGQTGIGDGNTCPLFDGANDYVDIYSAGFAGAFDGDEGAVSVWAKVLNAAVWEDANRRYVTALYKDVQNRNFIRKNNAPDDQMYYFHEANDTHDDQTKSGMTEAGWMHLAITWSVTNNQVIYYYNGSQEGDIDVGMDNWVGTLTDGVTCIGSGTTAPLYVWNGYLAHCGVWDSPLSAASIAALAAV